MSSIRKSLKYISSLLAVIAFITLAPVTSIVHAGEAPYRAYTYDKFHNAIPSPHGYLPEKQLFGTDIGAGDFSNPNDLYVDKARNQLYIVDSGNNRIVVVNDEYELVRIIDEFYMGDEIVTLQNPMGIFVDKDGLMYITDQDNARVIVSDQDLNVVKIYGKPESDIMGKVSEYKPSKIVVDRYGRIYIQAVGVYEGLICLDSDGTFLGYYGSNRVEMTFQRLIQQFWKRILTREQAKAMQNFVPIEYSNVYIDDEGFIFATAAASATFEYQVMCLNVLGDDILRWRRLDWFEGSFFVDIHVDDYGFVTVLDASKGKVYQVEPDEGRMMFAFGGKGDMIGTFVNPVSIESFNDCILVLDSEKNAITIFRLTSFGKAVRNAQVLYMDGKYEESVQPWMEVVKRDSNYLFAYVGLGKAYYQMEDYKKAMEYFKLGYSKQHYSDALKEHLIITMRSNFGYIALGFILVIALLIGLQIYRKRRAANGYGHRSACAALANIKYMFYTIVHPFNGYDGIKFERKGSLTVALILILLFFLQNVMVAAGSGFLFTSGDPDRISVFNIFAISVGIIALWIVSNWAVGSLINAEGKTREIVIVSAYSLVPYIMVSLFNTFISNFVTLEVQPFMNMLKVIGTAWSAFIMFVGMYQVHQLTFRDTFFMLTLTVLGMAIMVFLMVLVYSLYHQMYIFLYTIFSELMFRI